MTDARANSTDPIVVLPRATDALPPTMPPPPPLEYAAGLPAPPPVRDFLLTGLNFAAAHWLTDCAVTRFLVARPGPVEIAWPQFWGRAYWAGQSFELVLAACAAAVLIAVQWLLWRARPTDAPRRAWPAAIVAGWLFCAAGWWMYARSNRPPMDSELVQTITKLILAALLGVGLAAFRVFARRRVP
jgi:hypothetical protein